MHMRIGIDARFWGTDAKGLGRYTQELVSRLGVHDPETEYIVFMRPDGYASFSEPPKNVKKVLADYRWYSLKEQIALPRLLRSHHCDLVHFPHFNVPLFAPKPFVVTIHDLILSRYPSVRATTLGPLRYAIKHAGYQLTIGQALKRAEHIIAISQFTKQDILRSYAVAEKDISVIYEGVTTFPQPNSTSSPESKYGITTPFFLYVGNAYPHKNLERLITVFSKARKSGLTHSLVLVGKKDFFYTRLQAYAKERGLSGIHFTGFVPDEDLGTLYARASWYIFPSLYEGFGLPPLEALRMGTPVMASNASCLPEILGDAAIYFSPENEHDMIQVLLKNADNEAARNQSRLQAAQVLSRYSWDRMCTDTISRYHTLIQTHG